jgi:hypothetical protein
MGQNIDLRRWACWDAVRGLLALGAMLYMVILACTGDCNPLDHMSTIRDMRASTEMGFPFLGGGGECLLLCSLLLSA